MLRTFPDSCHRGQGFWRVAKLSMLRTDLQKQLNQRLFWRVAKLSMLRTYLIWLADAWSSGGLPNLVCLEPMATGQKKLMLQIIKSSRVWLFSFVAVSSINSWMCFKQRRLIFSQQGFSSISKNATMSFCESWIRKFRPADLE